MKSEKKLAFIAAIAMLAGTQTGFVSALEADIQSSTSVSVSASKQNVTPKPDYSRAKSVKEKAEAEAPGYAREHNITDEEALKQLEEQYRVINGSRVIFTYADLMSSGEGLTNPLISGESEFIAGLLGCESVKVQKIILQLCSPILTAENPELKITAGDVYARLEEQGFDCSELWLTEIPQA